MIAFDLDKVHRIHELQQEIELHLNDLFGTGSDQSAIAELDVAWQQYKTALEPYSNHMAYKCDNKVIEYRYGDDESLSLILLCPYGGDTYARIPFEFLNANPTERKQILKRMADKFDEAERLREQENLKARKRASIARLRILRGELSTEEN